MITKDVIATLTASMPKPAVKLTPRQREVLRLIVEGRRMKETGGCGADAVFSFHALQQSQQGLIKSLYPDYPPARELQVENDMHRHRDGGHKAQHVESVALLATRQTMPGQHGSQQPPTVQCAHVAFLFLG
jgi:hypothetical protein